MRHLILISGIVSTSFTSTSFAIERLTPIQEPDESVAHMKASTAQSQKPWLGVAGQPIDPEMAKSLGLSHGVTVELVSPHGSAAQAGIKKYDVITEINGEKIVNMTALKNALTKAKVGSAVDITCMSDGQLVTREVTLQARPSHLAQRSHEIPQIQGDVKPRDSKPMPDGLRHLPSSDQQRLRELFEARNREMEERMARLQKQFLQDSNLGHDKLQQGMRSSFSSSLSFMDEQGSVQVQSNSKDGKHITVKDRQGKVVFAGPYETEADKNAVPADVRKRVDALGINQTEVNKGTAGMSFFPFGR